MAGLTKEQRAEREAKPKETPNEVTLIAMFKGDDEIEVHPTCVDAHKKAKWQVKD